jgi:hypothetical protein
MHAEKGSPRGWRAPYYNFREPALSVDLTAQTDAVSFATLFGPKAPHVTTSEAMLQLRTDDWRGIIHLQTELDGERSLLVAVSLAGALEAQWRLSSCKSY